MTESNNAYYQRTKKTRTSWVGYYRVLVVTLVSDYQPQDWDKKTDTVEVDMNEIARLFSVNSFGKFNLVIDDIGRVDYTGKNPKMGDPTAVWDLTDNAAKDFAKSKGYDSRNYDVLVYKIRGGFTGLGTQGDFRYTGEKMILLNRFIPNNAGAHEVGHTLGLGHSNGFDCGEKQYETNCEYADAFSVMASSGPVFSIPNRRSMGWLEPTSYRTIGPSDLASGQLEVTIKNAYTGGRNDVIGILYKETQPVTRRESKSMGSRVMDELFISVIKSDEYKKNSLVLHFCDQKQDVFYLGSAKFGESYDKTVGDRLRFTYQSLDDDSATIVITKP
jgi:hypothetical protein